MRSGKAILFGAIVAVAGLLAAAGTMAQAPSSCQAGPYLVDAVGPTYPEDCGGCTEIQYIIHGKPDHVATVVASASTDCSTPSILDVYGEQITGNQWYDPAVGDPITELGKYACHEEAAKVNPNDTVSDFTIRVSGVRSPAPKSVVVKKGGKVDSCEIIGIGEEGVVAPVTEILRHEDCAVEFTLDRATGRVLSAQLTTDSPSNCNFIVEAVENLDLKLGGRSLGNGQFGDGYIQSGSSSCTTRIIGGKVYTWGRPCP